MYNKLKQPPYQNWFWRRQGIDGAVDTTSPIDPATLEPSEHYKEDGWSAPAIWTEDLVGTRIFDTDSGVPTLGTYDSKTYGYFNSGGSIQCTANPRVLGSWTTTDDWITLYFVFSWTGTTSAQKTFMWFNGLDTSLLRWKISTARQMYVQINNSGQDIIINGAASPYTGTIIEDGWNVVCIKIKNIANDGELNWYRNQDAVLTETNASWVAMGMDNYGSVNRLLSNNTLTEKWAGGVGEMLLFRDEHSENTISRVNQFLMDKWSIE